MAPAPVYIETEEEIPEVIERLRLNANQEIPIVLPARSRIGQSRFNFQLLQHYAAQHGKRVAIISSDPAVQKMAEETGLAAFGALDQYGPAEAVPVGAAPAAAAAPGFSWPPQPSPRPIPARTTRAASTLPTLATRAAGAGSRFAAPLQAGIGALSGGQSEPGRFLLYGGAVLVLLVGILAMALYLPSATVTLTTAAKPTAWEGDLQAQPGRPPIHVRTAASQKQASQGFKTTGVKVTPAQNAIGSVVWTNRCPEAAFTVPNGQRLDGGGAQFAQQGDLTVPSRGNVTANIAATSGGTKGNVGANQITNIEGASPEVTLCLSVNNPNPTSGGADEKRENQLSQADWDNARAQLQQQLTKQVGDDLNGKTAKGERLADKLALQPADFTADHHPGDLVSNFNGSMTLKGEGSYYSVDDVNKAIASHLKQNVQAGYQVTDNQVQGDFQVIDSKPGGELTFHAKGHAFIAPKLDNERIKNLITGKSPSRAHDTVLGAYPIRSVEIRQSPFKLPIMPLLSSRIDIKYVVEQGAVQKAA